MLKKLSKNIALTSVAVCFAVQVFANDFPVTFKHKFGTTTIEKQPERILTLDYSGLDNLLALGKQPIAIREGYSDTQKADPWAESLLTTDPVVLKSEYDLEEVARLKPDVILALYSGIDTKEYEKLSQIAPVVAVPKGMGDWSMPWGEKTIMTGKALGVEAEATKKVKAVEDLMKSVATKHPSWKGTELALAKIHSKTELGIYTNGDVRMSFFENLGFAAPQNIKKLGDKFTVQFSAEKIELLDVNLIVWYPFSDEHFADDFAYIKAFPGHKLLKAYKEGREIYLDTKLRNALFSSSLLSLPYAIEQIVPKIEKVLDVK